MENFKIKKGRTNFKLKRSNNAIIDSRVKPRIPIPEWIIFDHKGEEINWNPKKISLLLLNKQKEDGVFIRPEILIEKFHEEESSTK